MQEHPARRQVVGEMHLRRWPPITAPALIIQWLRLANEDQRAGHRKALQEVAGQRTLQPMPDHRHVSGQLSDSIAFAWEAHSEACSLTMFADGAGEATMHDPRSDAGLKDFMEIAETLSGEVVRATQIWVARDNAAGEAMLAAAGFDNRELVSCQLGSGVRLWSDFRIHEGGYGRVLLAANGLGASALARLVQRLQELGNYRNLALLGLPVARSSWSELNAVEEELRRIGDEQLESDMRDDEILAHVSGQSQKLTSLATSANYRMSATAAYAQLVEDRLAELDVRPVEGYPSLVDFTQRRFLPAVRTCAAFSARVDQLSGRAAQLTALLRARIETRIENQNARLLASMERSAVMQLRLQQLVEGLSVVALSYYGLGLLGYMLRGIEHIVPGIQGDVIEAALVLPLVATVWLVMKTMKKRIMM